MSLPSDADKAGPADGGDVSAIGRPVLRDGVSTQHPGRAGDSGIDALKPVWTILLHLGLLLLALVFLIPFFWLICAAFKQPEDIFGYAFLPWRDLHRLTLDNFRSLFHDQPYGRWLINSLFVACAQTVLVVTFSSMGGFALAKYEFRGKRIVMLLMLATMLLPGVVLLAGSVELMIRIGWMNSYSALIFPGAASVFGTFLFRQAMLGVPDELLAAGRIDGCSELRLWWEVALPVVRPMVAAFTFLSFLAAWNSYLWPVTVLQDQSKFTLPMGLASMMGVQESQSQYGILMAGTLVGIVPVAILFFAMQRDFIAGLASGAVKG
ncbi:MAG TPA: carbohydrate ABC transporter permease [Tepidisphaeraceae bacterium]|jgi:ABC-type glycerol-3-phosphate transport system permease component|nr:carbohydrate ABC transporter permease [Tepidisphaeraceae bacterium]